MPPPDAPYAIHPLRTIAEPLARQCYRLKPCAKIGDALLAHAGEVFGVINEITGVTVICCLAFAANARLPPHSKFYLLIDYEINRPLHNRSVPWWPRSWRHLSRVALEKMPIGIFLATILPKC
jgi:hypothetical protein